MKEINIFSIDKITLNQLENLEKAGYDASILRDYVIIHKGLRGG